MRHALILFLLAGAFFSQPGYGDDNEKNKTEAKEQAKAKEKSSARKEGPIRLESVFVGDKEQPAVSYFIPWQGVGTPDKLHWNMEKKHDDELKMVDREVMLRSMQLYNEMQLEAPQN